MRDDFSLRGASDRDGAWGNERFHWGTGGCRTASIPEWDAICQDANGWNWSRSCISRVPPQEPWEAQTLVWRFHSRCATDCLSKVLTHVQNKKFEMLHHLHLLSSRLTHQKLCAVFPEVWKQFFLCVRDCWGWLCWTHTYNLQTTFPQSSHWVLLEQRIYSEGLEETGETSNGTSIEPGLFCLLLHW